MNNRFSPFICFLLCSLLSFNFPTRAEQNSGWDVAVLDQILAGVQSGQKLVTIGDMQISVSKLTAWHNQLAGIASPLSAFDGVAATWPNGMVYYTFSTNVAPVFQKAVLDAAAEWGMFANVQFVPRTTEANYVTIQIDQALEGGLSAVGMIGGQQFLSISPGAFNRGTLCHEIGHTLGLVHEHQRSDRDSFVTIMTNNITNGAIANFTLLSNSRNQGAYDFLSVMHYARNYLSISSNLDTIVPLPAFIQFINVMGVHGAVTLSDGDRAGMAAVYGAVAPVTPVVTNTADSGPGTLRAALYYAFDHPGTRIIFNIPTNDLGYANGVFTIQPSDELPMLVNGTAIEGASQPTNSTSNTNGPLIQINGSAVPPGTFANGLHFSGTNCFAHALVINGFPASGALFDSTNATGNDIGGCYLGIDPSGTFAVTNGLSPVTIDNGAHGDTVGGIAASNRNVISGSLFQGVVIRDAGTHGNVVEGNWIGLNAAGNAALPNGFSGTGIVNGASGNIIGGIAPGAGNVISGNSIQGVAFRDPGTINNVVEGNLIGLNPAGNAAIPNVAAGVEIFLNAQSNIVGPGNIISGNDVQGVDIDGVGVTGNVVEGNFIGLNKSGTAAIPNGGAGVGLFASAQSNIIGSTMPGARNIISGNTLQGVAIGNPGTSGNVVEGNYIGTDPSGTFSISNLESGVNLFDTASRNLVGGLPVGAGNLISGNVGQGVSFQDAGTANNLVEGNLIGLTAAGNISLPNSVGIEMFANAGPGNVIGTGNTISGNSGDGVLLDNGASSNTVRGNFLGLDVTGINAVPNGNVGIEMFLSANNNFVGGIGDGRNYISGNTGSGISIEDTAISEIVQGNTIGLNIAGTPVPNLGAGITFFNGAQSNVVGGVLPGEANLIADNGGNGVELFNTNSFDNSVRGNSIFGNNSAILDFNANNSDNESAPNLISATVTTNTTINGSLSSIPSTTFHLDFYANPPSGQQGQTYIGTRDFATGANGLLGFTATLPGTVPAGNFVTVSATDTDGNTSQLSPGIAVTAMDSVGDGIPDAWRAAHFGTPNSTNAQSCATCDPDNDGMNNRQEFLAGTDPNNATSKLLAGSIAPNGTDLVVSFSSVSGITYRVESKDDLTAANWSLFADQILGPGGVIQLVDPGAASLTQRYYRLDVLP